MVERAILDDNENMGESLVESDDHGREAIRTAWAACFAVVCCIAWELYSLSVDPSEGSWLATTFHIFSLYGVWLPVYLLIWMTFWPPLIRTYPSPLAWIGIGLTAEQRKTYLIRSVERSIFLILVGGSAGVAAAIARSFNRPLLAIAWVALLSIAGVIFAWLLTPTWRAITSKMLNFAPSSICVGRIPLSILPLGVMLIIGGFAGIQVAGLDLGAYQLGGYLMLVILSLLTLVSDVLLSFTKLVFRRSLPLCAMVVVVLCGSLWGLSGWDERHPSNLFIPQQALLSSLLLNQARVIADQDGDGVSASLGGGDCDDQNPLVHPQAKEIPENGIDDNCEGGDAQKPKVAPPPVIPKLEVKAKKWNVVFLLVDTLRASHLDMNGYARPTMPHLKRFAEEAVIFDRAFAHAPRTPFSIPSVLTGRYPSRIKWVKRFTNYSVLKDENETIFERFQAGGWRTEAVSAHWYFGVKKGVNINQGLDVWDNEGERSVSESNTQSEAAGITQRLIKRLSTLSTSSSEQPFFIFAHYFAPHGRYMNHRVKCKKSKKWCHREPRCAEHPTQCVFGSPKDRSVKKLINKYDSELAYTDLYLGDVFKAYQELGLDKNTILIVTSDHGESFKDRKPAYLFHGRSVYNEELHVPLVIKTPDSQAERRDEVVGLVDLSPTLSALTGVKRGEVDGLSLSPLLGPMKGTDEVVELFKNRTIYLEQLPYPGHKVHMVAGVNGQGIKLIRDVSKRTWSLFDLNQDWSESQNLWGQEGKKQGELQSAVIQFIEQTP